MTIPKLTQILKLMCEYNIVELTIDGVIIKMPVNALTSRVKSKTKPLTKEQIQAEEERILFYAAE